MEFRHYQEEYYQDVCDFLININKKDISHINWNWARFEWMYEHPYTDKSLMNRMGLWFDKNKIVGAALFDMYLGEAFVGVLKEYQPLYVEVLKYAYKSLKDENGLGIAICDDNLVEIELAKDQGFVKSEQTETMLSIKLNKTFTYQLPEGYYVKNLDPIKEKYALMWLFWRGFDHGNDKEEFERTEDLESEMRLRKHYISSLSVAAYTKEDEPVAYCSLWYDNQTDYAYLEPVCTVPEHRHKGLAKAIIYEALNRVKELGAKKVYVLSDQEFYKKIGMKFEKHFTFYWKKENE